MISSLIKALLDEIPEESEISLDHANVHLDMARRSIEADTKHAMQDFSMAGRILIVWAYYDGKVPDREDIG